MRFSDWFHRCWNDLQHAIAKAGLMPVWYATAFLYNIGHGPWQSKRYWPRLLVDKNLHHETSDELVGRVGRERFIENLAARSQQVTDFKGHKVKPAQWVSWNKAHDEWDAELSTRGMLLGQLSMNKGWILSSEDLFSGARNIAALSQDDAPKPACKAAAVRSAKAKLEALKKKR